MNISITNNQKTENTQSIKLQEGDTEVLSHSGTAFAEILNGKINENAINTENVDNLKDIDFFCDAISMELQDALFFINLSNEGQFSVQTSSNGDIQSILKTELTQNIVTQKTVDVSNQLITLIDKAQKSQKPVRISFDNDISVVLKIDKQGKLSAEFIPGSIEAENYLMNNVSSLKQRFDEQNLPYTSLSYRNRGNRNKDKNKGEK